LQGQEKHAVFANETLVNEAQMSTCLHATKILLQHLILHPERCLKKGSIEVYLLEG
jgi:hypothetical protein